MNARSVRYMPRYGTHGGLQLYVRVGGERLDQFQRQNSNTDKTLFVAVIYFFSVSLRFLNLPSEDTVFCSRSISAFVCNKPTKLPNNNQ